MKRSRHRSRPTTRHRPDKKERQRIREKYQREAADGEEPSHHADEDDVGRGDNVEEEPVSPDREEGRTDLEYYEEEVEHPRRADSASDADADYEAEGETS